MASSLTPKTAACFIRAGIFAHGSGETPTADSCLLNGRLGCTLNLQRVFARHCVMMKCWRGGCTCLSVVSIQLWKGGRHERRNHLANLRAWPCLACLAHPSPCYSRRSMGSVRPRAFQAGGGTLNQTKPNQIKNRWKLFQQTIQSEPHLPDISRKTPERHGRNSRPRAGLAELTRKSSSSGISQYAENFPLFRLLSPSLWINWQQTTRPAEHGKPQTITTK